MGGGGVGRRKDFYMQLHHHAKKSREKTPTSWVAGLEQPLNHLTSKLFLRNNKPKCSRLLVTDINGIFCDFF